MAALLCGILGFILGLFFGMGCTSDVYKKKIDKAKDLDELKKWI